MDVFPKFIIEADSEEGHVLIIGRCTYHKQLGSDITKIIGGGSWSLDYDNKTFTLFGSSHDFGTAKFEDISNCVKNKKVFTNKYLTKNLSENFNFNYRNEIGDLFNILK